MRILITGSNGMLGRDLSALLRARHEVLGADLPNVDITSLRLVQGAIQGARLDAVIHTAAFTAVDDCERRPEFAFQVNAEGTRNVAFACRESSIPLLYISTDYVFDGSKPAPYIETDTPNPLNVYGASKLQGEQYIAESLPKAVAAARKIAGFNSEISVEPRVADLTPLHDLSNLQTLVHLSRIEGLIFGLRYAARGFPV